ncbi:1-acyl-sn-glycerol-3-phosphate acyltransferase [Pseudoalteromonas citrea]|uniref:1-acyl-sn-glycerol-3-phosphate acyltransferase n=3 Tax=Pseudoalteromonas citrea TaxID=43655 RepID=A0AAD4FS95_9GAMM|nr:1-acylglycerol-3-phosphate O-acyltransferase [Pseudoalteromonas citrea]KAF7772001.1 1-acyl-sn-glycerol-3-phosphate acyltransferase [Pseudoalteromonas citrea]
MLVLLRIVAMALFIVISGILGLLMCLVRPFHRNNVHVIASWFGKMSRVIGVKLVITRHPDSEQAGPAIYVANHQNNYDLFTLPAAVPKSTVSMGKESLKWIPFFGQMYWLSGNILINRTNRSKAMGTLGKSADKIKQQGLSVWMFPEGTRSYGRGLLPFKTGAFHTAMNADVPVIPVCMNTTHNCIKLNRWDNGTIYIDMLAPVYLDKETSARDHASAVQALMSARIAELDVKMRETNGKLARN